MLAIKRGEALELVSNIFPCRNTKLTGILACVIPCQIGYIF